MVSSPTGGGWWRTPAAWVRNTAAACRQLTSNDTFREAGHNLLLIGIWYSLSTTLGIYNKTLLGKKHGLMGKGAFPAPLFMSGVQFFLQFVFAKIVFWCELIQRSQNAPMDRSSYWKIVVPNGILTGTDIGFSNKSLVYITMSFYTMCKSTVPIFLLLCAFLWRIERPSWELGGVVSVIVLGLVFLVKGEADFNLLGFMLVMSASAMSGVRFTLTQVSLHGHEGSVSLGGPLEVLELLTPIMSISSISMSLFWEQIWTLSSSPYLNSLQAAMTTLAIVAVGAVLAFLMVWTEYKVILQTSALTFMIAGTCKEVVTVLVAVLWFHDSFGPINGVGLVIVILGVVLFNVHKWRKMKEGIALQQSKVDGGADDTELEPLVVNATGSQQPSQPGSQPRSHGADNHREGSMAGVVLANGSSACSNGGTTPVPASEVQVLVVSKGGTWSSKGGAASPTTGRHKVGRSESYSEHTERDALLPKP